MVSSLTNLKKILVILIHITQHVLIVYITWPSLFLATKIQVKVLWSWLKNPIRSLPYPPFSLFPLLLYSSIFWSGIPHRSVTLPHYLPHLYLFPFGLLSFRFSLLSSPHPYFFLAPALFTFPLPFPSCINKNIFKMIPASLKTNRNFWIFKCFGVADSKKKVIQINTIYASPAPLNTMICDGTFLLVFLLSLTFVQYVKDNPEIWDKSIFSQIVP